MTSSSTTVRVLIADDEADLRQALKNLVLSIDPSYLIEEATDGAETLKMGQDKSYDLILLDVMMPRFTGLEILAKLKQANPSTTVVIVTAHANIKDAVQAVQEGAFDYIEKPLKKERLEQILKQVENARELVHQVALSSPSEGSDAGGFDFVGESKPMRKIFQLIDRLAKVNTSVLIRGDNGTGKELVARAIHYNSPRKDKPFVAINCGAIPEALMESEFFGHEKGAFTGAETRKIGKFQYASGGTLFLDEIAELPQTLQVKLLRVLQERKITPVGSNREFTIDIRIVAATNRNLEKMMDEGAFRSDLFYRLNVMPLFLPPLRERTEDLPLLVQHFITRFNKKHVRQVRGVEPQALELLKLYTWPGNIRELENAIEHAFVLETETQLRLDSFPEHIRESISDAEEGWKLPNPQESYKSPAAGSVSNDVALGALDFQKSKEEFEKSFIVQALKQNEGRINQTCETANIPKNTLLRKMRKYGITAKDGN